MTSSVSPVGSAKPAFAWAFSRLSSLDPWSRSGGGIAADGGRETQSHTPVAAGVSQGSSGATQVGHRPDEGLRGWIEDRLLVELAARMLPPHLQPVSPEAHVMALREAVLHLDQGVSHPDALRVLKESVADHDALRQGRCALQGV